MPIDLRELGAKCRRLRVEILNLTVEQTAERTGIEAGRINGIEAGNVEPSGDEVLILADVYGEPVDYFITNERSASIEKASDLYRMYGTTFSSADRQSIQEFLKLCRMEHEIEALLGARPRVFDFQPGRPDTHMKTHGRQTAEKLRRDLGFGDRPIDNPFHLARTLGCHVFRRSLRNSKVSGVMLRHDDFGPCILVNYLDDSYRQNFSVAHELCHAILDNDCNVTVSFERPGDEEIEDRKRREWRANSFASHLLFPQSVRERLKLGATDDDRSQAIRHAADSYRINPVVVLYALQEAKRLTKQEVATLHPGLKIPRAEKDDADLDGETARIRERRKRHLESGLSPEYVETCVRAYREGEISLGRLSDALLSSPVDLSAVLANLGYSFPQGDVSA
jgi:Zn-dependent peptidase ImmA (M78 family)/transcriptional regulator with XRE-family HTH domain